MRNSSQNANLTSEALAETKMLVDMGIKRCTTCNELKSLDLFPKASKGVGGVGSRCKVCTSAQEKAIRAEKVETDLIFRVTKAILKRQRHGTHICWLVDHAAHKSAAHLLGEYGLMNATDAHAFGSVFMNNLPEKIRKLEDKARKATEARLARSAKTEKSAADRQAKRDLKKTIKRLGNIGGLSAEYLTDAEIEKMVYLRLQYHLKNKRRRLKVTDYSFTRKNFTGITGYSIKALREHLHSRIPDGKSWTDVFYSELIIEHIIPSAAFDLTTLAGLRNCYALSNLTLIPAIDNAVKGGTVDRDTVAYFREDPESARLFGLVE